MGKIVISQNVTLDGVVEDPTGEGDLRRGGWFADIRDEDRQAWGKLLYEEAAGAEALLLGRHSEAWFGSRWSAREGAWADRLNAMPKYVVSSTLAEPAWSNSTILGGEVPSEVEKLRDAYAGEIVVYASRALVQGLFEHDLVDELRLIVFPVVLGDGARLFGELGDKLPLRLLDSRTLGGGLAHLRFAVTGHE